MREQQTQDPISALLSEFGTRLNEVEEKQRLLRDRALLIGENLISTKEENEKHNKELKKQITLIESEIKSLKQISQRIINEMPVLARKSELEILERQFKMFQPLEFARIKDVKDIVKETLNK